MPHVATPVPATGPRLTYAFARAHGIVLLSDAPPWQVGALEGADPHALLEVRRVLGAPFALATMTRDAFEAALTDTYRITDDAARSIAQGLAADHGLDTLADDASATADILDSEDDAPVIRLINGLIAEAIKQSASDIHIEPFEHAVIIRLRIDGAMREVIQAPARVRSRLVSRIKVMSRLDIAERRLPQDGRMSVSLGGRTVDVRVATLPSRHGERVVLRLLDKDAGLRSLDALGMSTTVLTGLRAAIEAPNGIVLVTGPTGSGKTTTLYAAISALNDRARNIMTVEDPIEYAMDGVGQMQVNAKIGLTFAAGLRAILRQDPDIVMVGEIRDPETAQVAVQASLTGHLVFSSAHTNDAAAAFTRLRDMGVESYLLASTVRAVLAQRLVRRLCGHCKRPAVLGEAERALMASIGASEAPVYEGVGCAQCQGVGYTGRIGLYELIRVDDVLRRLINDGASEAEIAAHGLRGQDTLLRAGLRAVAAGSTSISDILRAISGAAEA